MYLTYKLANVIWRHKSKKYAYCQDVIFSKHTSLIFIICWKEKIFQSDMQVGTWLRKAFQGITNSNEDLYLNMHKDSYAEAVSLILWCEWWLWEYKGFVLFCFALLFVGIDCFLFLYIDTCNFLKIMAKCPLKK